jgi:hypothetical protein
MTKFKLGDEVKIKKLTKKEFNQVYNKRYHQNVNYEFYTDWYNRSTNNGLKTEGYIFDIDNNYNCGYCCEINPLNSNFLVPCYPEEIIGKIGLIDKIKVIKKLIK